MKMNIEKIGRFLIITEHNSHKDIKTKTVCLDYIPVAKFCEENKHEPKLAAISLIERGLCDQKISAQICGLHRNTISKVLNLKQTLGIEAVFKDDRGLKSPYKYTGDIRLHIVHLLDKHPDSKIRTQPLLCNSQLRLPRL